MGLLQDPVSSLDQARWYLSNKQFEKFPGAFELAAGNLCRQILEQILFILCFFSTMPKNKFIKPDRKLKTAWNLYEQLKNRTLVLANLIPQTAIKTETKQQEIQKLIEKRFAQDIGDKVVQFLGWITTDSELEQIEFEQAVKTLQNQESRRAIYTIDQPNHILSKTLIDLIPIMFEGSN